MIKPKREITDAVDAVYAATRDLRRGQTLLHETIERLLGVDRHVGMYDHVVKRVRRRLQDERAIATWPEPTVGYRLCTIPEQLALPLVRSRRASRQIRRGIRSVEALDGADLTIHQRVLQARTLEAAKDAASHVHASIREHTGIFAERAETPRRPLPPERGDT